MNISSSKSLMTNTRQFLTIKYINRFLMLFIVKAVFYGWGRKKSGHKAIKLAKRHKSSFILLEDGFIRSIGLGVDGSPSFSLVEDSVGIYYDATVPSYLENILNSYDFTNDIVLMSKAERAIQLIREYNVSKYNHAPIVNGRFCNTYSLDISNRDKNVLVIAQTAGDSSLEYGLASQFSTDDIINTAITENPNSKIYLKIHPDVLSGKKHSDIIIGDIPNQVTVITEDVNPISLLKCFDKVYTKTSGMGFEALLVGCECVCFGMPYYAGWGITDDRVACSRRSCKLSVLEVFAAAYILYTRYVNPYTKQPIGIIETIHTIVELRS